MLALVLPVVLLVLLRTTAISLTVDDLPIVVQDLDNPPPRTISSTPFAHRVTFHVVSWPVGPAGRKTRFTSNKARGVLIIPGNFGRDIARGDDTPVQILVDASDSNTAQLDLRAMPAKSTQAYNQTHGGAATHRSRCTPRSGSGTTPAGRRRNSTDREFSCWAFACFRRCWRRWRWPRRANRKPSCRSMSPAFRRTNFCSARFSRS